ncbi:hypothetical protein M9980_00660 [Sphingomonas donggukensis]|uniref:MPN domain-containing protein n=1 Tax=Sphingomonas donggukensis TaxID=2949093 RepID=A0ABY4TTX4_9SPHN|nr:JAB domain-containing protein [Sphingomonas donggukensis]URW75783.1 hypothetical protein M9980_00660 [Sphingomonas donggukensis]
MAVALPAPVIVRCIDGVPAARALFADIATAPHEIAGIAYLARDRTLLGLRHIRGGRDRVAVLPRLLAGDALSLDARFVVMAHNHPSGDVSPSPGDLAWTRAIARVLDGIEVRMVDALILAGDRTTSFRALGLL